MRAGDGKSRMGIASSASTGICERDQLSDRLVANDRSSLKVSSSSRFLPATSCSKYRPPSPGRPARRTGQAVGRDLDLQVSRRCWSARSLRRTPSCGGKNQLFSMANTPEQFWQAVLDCKVSEGGRDAELEVLDLVEIFLGDRDRVVDAQRTERRCPEQDRDRRTHAANCRVPANCRRPRSRPHRCRKAYRHRRTPHRGSPQSRGTPGSGNVASADAVK